MDFNSILIGSENPQRLVDYYTPLLGEPAFSGDGYTAWHLGVGWVTIGPHSEVHGKNAQPGRLIWNIESNDVAGDFERFKAAGAIVVTAPYGFEGGPERRGPRPTFADPDDNYFQPRPRSDVPCLGRSVSILNVSED
jgi:hypothetical protein